MHGTTEYDIKKKHRSNNVFYLLFYFRDRGEFFRYNCHHFNGLSDIQKKHCRVFVWFNVEMGNCACLHCFFSSQHLGDIIDYLCTSWLYALIFSFVHFLSCLFTYYLCWIHVLEVRINIIIIIIIIISQLPWYIRTVSLQSYNKTLSTSPTYNYCKSKDRTEQLLLHCRC